MIIKDLRETIVNDFVVLNVYMSWNNKEFNNIFIAAPKEFEDYLDGLLQILLLLLLFKLHVNIMKILLLKMQMYQKN